MPGPWGTDQVIRRPGLLFEPLPEEVAINLRHGFPVEGGFLDGDFFNCTETHQRRLVRREHWDSWSRVSTTGLQFAQHYIRPVWEVRTITRITDTRFHALDTLMPQVSDEYELYGEWTNIGVTFFICETYISPPQTAAEREVIRATGSTFIFSNNAFGHRTAPQ